MLWPHILQAPTHIYFICIPFIDWTWIRGLGLLWDFICQIQYKKCCNQMQTQTISRFSWLWYLLNPTTEDLWDVKQSGVKTRNKSKKAIKSKRAQSENLQSSKQVMFRPDLKQTQKHWIKSCWITWIWLWYGNLCYPPSIVFHLSWNTCK